MCLVKFPLSLLFWTFFCWSWGLEKKNYKCLLEKKKKSLHWNSEVRTWKWKFPTDLQKLFRKAKLFYPLSLVNSQWINSSYPLVIFIYSSLIPVRKRRQLISLAPAFSLHIVQFPDHFDILSQISSSNISLRIMESLDYYLSSDDENSNL